MSPTSYRTAPPRVEELPSYLAQQDCATERLPELAPLAGFPLSCLLRARALAVKCHGFGVHRGARRITRFGLRATGRLLRLRKVVLPEGGVLFQANLEVVLDGHTG